MLDKSCEVLNNAQFKVQFYRQVIRCSLYFEHFVLLTGELVAGDDFVEIFDVKIVLFVTVDELLLTFSG